MNRPWGEEKDREAARQLDAPVGYTIFMMGTEADYLDDIRAVATEFEDLGFVPASEVVDAVEERIQRVKLPNGFALVGMMPLGGDGPRIYGVVDFSMFGRGQGG